MVTNDFKLKQKVEEYLTFELKKLFQERSVVLLKPMTNDEALIVFDIIKDNDNVVSRVIQIDEKPTIFLKYQEDKDEKINRNWNTISVMAKKLYDDRKYSKALNLYLDIIRTVPKPKPFCFFKVGIINLKLHNKQEALKYLLIADGLNKKGKKINSQHDLSELISNLKNNIYFHHQKETWDIKMDEVDFQENDKNKKLEDIAALIKEDNLNLNDTCNSYNLTVEETLLVKLIYARNSYASKNFIVGDKALKEVEKSKEKTENVKVLLKEITINKKMYQYRQK